MHDLETIAAAIAPTVRYEESTGDAPPLDADLTTPTTARLIKHPLLSPSNLFALTEEANIAAVDYNTWLRNIRLESARNVFQDVMRKKKTDQQTKEMLDNLVVYSGVGRLNDRITPRDRLVGFEIRLLNSNNIKVMVEKIMTHFDSTESFNLYVFHSESPLAIATIPIVQGVALQAEWHDIDQELNYRDFANNIAGGTYFFMYDESDLTGQAINQRLNFGYTPCRSCNADYHGRYRKYSQYVLLRTVAVSAGNKPPAGEMFDVQDVSYQENTTWGLNFALTSYCDLTDYIVNHPDIFSDALNKEVQTYLVRELVNATRSNVITEKIKQNARFSLQNAELGGENLIKQLEDAKKALGFELSDIQESVCMPKVASQGVKYGTVGNGYQKRGRGRFDGYY